MAKPLKTNEHKSPVEYYRIAQGARDRLAVAARALRAKRGTSAERELEWEPLPAGADPVGGVLQAKIPGKRGRILLGPYVRNAGTHYVSSCGSNSDDSFSGYLPGLTLEEAKLLVYQDAAKYY